MYNKNAFIKTGYYKCECGKEFSNSQSYYGHLGHCKVHLGDRYDSVYNKRFSVESNYKRGWLRGKSVNDPIYGDAIRKFVYSSKNNKGMLGHHQSEESKLKQSETRKRKYLSGELTPPKGVGRGKYSYLIYNNKRIMLRSTYEFIYALYLAFNNIDFKYESVRASYVDSRGKTKILISDFCIDNKIIEIKGYKTSKLYHAKKAFESLGFEYEIKYWSDLDECYSYLKQFLDISSILKTIKLCHDNRQYYEFNYDTYKVSPVTPIIPESSSGKTEDFESSIVGSIPTSGSMDP